MHKKISVIILGAGGRGTIYANLIKLMPEKAEVVAVAEPRDFFRNRIAMEHNIPEVNSFTDWHDVLKRPKFADAVIITTQDRMRVEPAVAFANKGYNLPPDCGGGQEKQCASFRMSRHALCELYQYAPRAYQKRFGRTDCINRASGARRALALCPFLCPRQLEPGRNFLLGSAGEVDS